MSFTPFLCSCEIVLCNLFGKILSSIILPRQGDGQMTYQVLPIWNISHVMTNFTVLLISNLQNAGTRHLHGNCSCHRLLLLQFSFSLFKLPLYCKLSCMNFFFHNVLEFLSVVGAGEVWLVLLDQYIFLAFAISLSGKASLLLLLSSAVRAEAKQW